MHARFLYCPALGVIRCCFAWVKVRYTPQSNCWQRRGRQRGEADAVPALQFGPNGSRQQPFEQRAWGQQCERHACSQDGLCSPCLPLNDALLPPLFALHITKQSLSLVGLHNCHPHYIPCCTNIELHGLQQSGPVDYMQSNKHINSAHCVCQAVAKPLTRAVCTHTLQAAGERVLSATRAAAGGAPEHSGRCWYMWLWPLWPLSDTLSLAQAGQCHGGLQAKANSTPGCCPWTWLSWLASQSQHSDSRG